MTYTTEITVNVTIDEFIKKMDNVENMKHWQRELVSAEHISGIPGNLGSKMKLTYKFGNHKMVLIETITKRNFPKELHINYSSKSMHNIQKNFFEKTSDGSTKWISECEFFPLNLTMRMMLSMMPRTFKKQTLKYMQDFKNFAEKGTSIVNA